ncbi:ABC transporter permease [Candidatus Woesearchaeota archaeon]|nr:ABC transporter permease [Candidatus Woesearchaeota archaeon]
MKWHRIKALLLKYFYISINSVDRWFDIFYWPIIDIFVWGFASFYIKELSNFNLLSVLMGGIILWVFVWKSSQDIATFVLEDFWARNLYNLFSSPMRISEHVASIIIFAFLRGLISFSFLILLAYLLYSFNIFTLPILFIAVAIFILSLIGWVIGLFIVSLILRFGQRIQILAWSIVWIVQPFSCVFYPLSSIPAWAKPIASILPTTYVFENMRAFFLEGRAINYGELLYAFMITLLLLVIVAIFLTRSYAKAKQSGILAKGD